MVGIISISIPLLSHSGKKVAALPALSGAPLKEGTARSHTVAKLIFCFGTQAKILWYALGQEQFTSECSPSSEKCQQGQHLASPEYAWLSAGLTVGNQEAFPLSCPHYSMKSLLILLLRPLSSQPQWLDSGFFL